jgi:hypothetical protein
LTNVTIGDSVTNIGEQSFFHSRLTSIILPNTVTSIGSQAFGDCYSLTNIFFLGNAPSANSTSFLPGLVTAYYLPGTTGWDDFLPNTGFATLLWNPTIETGDGSFGVQNNQFGFNITGTANIPILIEACTNLTNPVWTSLQTLTLTNGSAYFSEPFQPDSPSRYYRIRSPQ